MALAVTYTTIEGELIHETRGGVDTFYGADMLGSLIHLMDSAGNTTYSATYAPYGELLSSTGVNTTPWGFCGTWGYLSDTGARLYVRARYLRADQARWMTVDPLWPEEQAYGYVGQNPTTKIDPQGANIIIRRPPRLPWYPCGFWHWLSGTCDRGDIFGCEASCAKKQEVFLFCVKSPFTCWINCLCFEGYGQSNHNHECVA